MHKKIGAIGFGTTSLLGLEGEGARQRLLAEAFESGITHFDTAPYYGYGEAEKILGNFIKDRRESVTITTKFGIQPPRLAGGGSVAGAVKCLVKNLGPVRKLLARQAGKMVQRGAFSAADAEKSLETSLRSLQTDHIDIYLLHEAGPSDTSDELLAFLQKKQEQGLIGRFGVGSEFRKVREIAANRPEFCAVLQFENSATRPNLQAVSPLARETLAITHGALGESFRQLGAALTLNFKLREAISSLLGAEAGQPDVLSSAMLAWAAHDNPAGVVLFSSSRADNIRANVRALREVKLPSSQLAEFGRLAGLSSAPIREENKQ